MQPHEQIHHLSGVRTADQQVAETYQVSVTASSPFVFVVNDPYAKKQTVKLGVGAMYVTYRNYPLDVVEFISLHVHRQHAPQESSNQGDASNPKSAKLVCGVALAKSTSHLVGAALAAIFARRNGGSQAYSGLMPLPHHLNDTLSRAPQRQYASKGSLHHQPLPVDCLNKLEQGMLEFVIEEAIS
jgi:hypothetical protein